MKKTIAGLIPILTLVICFSVGVFSQTTEFTYQGSLQNSSVPASGNFDFEFLLYDSLTGGTQQGATLTRTAVSVSSGGFTVKLDFGSNYPGANRYLEIRVRPTGQPGITTLSPRQLVNSAPYSVKAANADTAVNATNAANATNAVNATSAATATNALQLGGVAANQYVLTGDARMSNARAPTADSTNYIQNIPGIGTQANASFNISGGGNANIFNSASQYNITGNRVLSVFGTSNTFAGINAGAVNTGANNAFFGNSAGQANTTASNNSFFGTRAGLVNTTGDFNAFFGTNTGTANAIGANNSFFGFGAGELNTSGGSNSFFGAAAGQSNIVGVGNSFFGLRAGELNSSGNGNSFFGTSAGRANTTGTNNTALGELANLGSGNLFYATAIGAGSVVSTSATVVLGRSVDTVQVPGNLNVNGTFSGNINGAGITNLNASSITSGTLNNARLGVVPVANGGTGSATQNFVDLTSAQTILGNKTFSNTLSGDAVNTVTQYNIGGNRILSTPAGDNIFAGRLAGFGNTSGSVNSFFGYRSGEANIGGSSNSFFGERSGLASQGVNNSFFGAVAGQSNVSGNDNTIIGTLANVGAPNLSFATAIGAGAIVSQSNSLVLGNGIAKVGIGTSIPGAKLSVVTGPVEIGGSAVSTTFRTTAGSLGNNAGDELSLASIGFASNNNSSLGIRAFRTAAGADWTTTAIGLGMDVDNTVRAGAALWFRANGDVGIGTNTPTERLYVVGNGQFTGNLTANIVSAATQYNIGGNRVYSVGVGGLSIFAGTNTGVTGFNNSFVGGSSGEANTTGDSNSFFGNRSGLFNTVGNANAFFGVVAGALNTEGNSNTFVGVQAGYSNTTGSLNTIIGGSADVRSPNLQFATALGAGALVSTNNTIALGRTNGSDKVVIYGLGSAGGLSLCQNASLQISSCGSSIRYKQNINPFSPGLSLIKQLRPVSFNWKDGGLLDMGLVAEEVAKVEPLLTTTNAKGEIEGVKYDRVGVVLINAVKEQQQQIEAQQKQIDEQNGVIKKQQADLDTLKAFVCSQDPAAGLCRPKF